MSQPSSHNPSGGSQKQPFSVYTMMLLVSAMALTIGTAFLYYEILRYGGITAALDTKPAIPQVKAK